ncbi:unnamed protein product [Mucor circinelloides]
MSRQIERPCRFGFPKPEAPITYMSEDHHVTYRRGVADCMVNKYNHYLLATFRTIMDIQYNDDGPQAIRYLAKYMSKDDYSTSVSFEKKGQQGYRQKQAHVVKESGHLKTRVIGEVEATTYDLLGWKKHYNSRNVIFLNTGLYNYDSLRIRNDIHDLPQDSGDVFAKTRVFIYEKRDGADTLTMPQFFFCFYIRHSQATSNEEETAIQ